MQNSFRGKDRVQLHITADKREIKDFPKLPSATSFIRNTLYAIGFGTLIIYKKQISSIKEG